MIYRKKNATRLWDESIYQLANNFLSGAGRRWQYLIDFFEPPSGLLNVSLGGSGTFNYLTTPARGDIARASTGATASSTVRWLTPASTPILSGGPTEKWIFAVRGRLQGTVDAQTLHQIGLTDSSAGTEQASFGVRGSVSTTQWALKAKTPAAVLGGTIDTDWHDFVVVNDGASLRLFIDGTQVATVSSASLDSITFRPDTYHQNGTTAEDRQFDYDKILIIGEDVTA